MKISTLAAGNFGKILRAVSVCLSLICMSVAGTLAQTTWNGNTDTDWNNATNWTDGVPDGSDAVTIGVTAHDPVISGAASVNSILISAGASLTIQAAGSLITYGSLLYSSPFELSAAVNNQGTITNNGQLTITATGPIGGMYGIINQGTFSNSGTGQVRIDKTTDTGIFNASGTFTNEASIAIGTDANVGYHGIWNDDTFTNSATGQIHIDRPNLNGIVNNSTGSGGNTTTFNNSGSITIGASSSVGENGIKNQAKFNHNAGGSIQVDRSSEAGIYNVSGTFMSGGAIVIGSIAGAGTNAVRNTGAMTISSCGTLFAYNGNFLTQNAVTNAGFIRIAGQLQVNGGFFDNNGVLKYGGVMGGFANNYLIVNNDPGPIFSYGAAFNGIVNGIFKDSEATEPAGNFTAPNTFEPNLATGNYTLYAKVTPVGNACSYVVPFTFSYTYYPAEITIKGNDVAIANADDTPDAADGTDFGAQFFRTGIVTRNFSIRNPGNKNLNLTGTPVVSLTGSADFTVTTQPAATVAPADTTTFGITFDPSSSGVKTATVSIASNDDTKNPFTFKIQGEGIEGCPTESATGTITWNGTISTDWNNHCNWTPAAQPGLSNDVVIPVTGNQPAIANGIAAIAQSVEIQSGATLTVATGGSLTINGSKSVSGIATAFYNAGTLQNDGSVDIGSAMASGQYGLWNTGTFGNNAGGSLNISRATEQALWNASGSFTNAGTVKIGTVGGGTAGLRNSASLSIAHCGNLLLQTGNFVTDATQNTVNAGILTIINDLINNGSFTNNGVLRYTSVTGDFTQNQLVVNSGAKPIFTIGPSFTGTIDGIYQDSEGTLSAGVYTMPNNFVPDPSIGEGVHTFFAKITPTGGGCTDMVPFQYEIIASQTVWTGSQSTDWNIPANWSNGVPETYTDAIIPNTTNKPAIGTAAMAHSVEIATGALLTINAGANLTVDGYATYDAPFTFSFTAALNNKGSVINHGSLILGSLASVGSYAILNQGSFENHPDAVIRIDRTTDTGIFNASGTFTNAADIIIGANGAIGLHGIWNDAVFNNNTGGEIRVDHSSAKALVNNGDETMSIHATFTNAAAITIGAAASVGAIGIHNMSAFDNHSGGTIHVDNTSNTGIYHAVGTFTNAADISIGANASVGDYAFNSQSTFTNEAGAHLRADRAQTSCVYVRGGAFTNAGSIAVGAIASTATTGLNNAGTFKNDTGAVIEIDRGVAGLAHSAGSFTNDGEITIGGSAVVSTSGLSINATFNNNAGGVIRVDRVDPSFTQAIALVHSGGNLTNGGSILLGSMEAAGRIGLRTRASFTNLADATISINRSTVTAFEGTSTFNNYGKLAIGSLSSVGTYGMDVTGSINNQTGGEIAIDNTTKSAVFTRATFTNAGKMTIGGSSPIGLYGIENGNGSAGTFINAVGAKLSIDRSGNAAITHIGTTFDNDGEITIGGTAETGIYGISNQKTFNNNTGGQIRIDRTTDTGIYQLKGTFTNKGGITIGANANVGVHGIFNETEFFNNEGGNIRIDRATLAGIRVFNGTFTNAAGIALGSEATLGTYGIQNQSFFINNIGGVIGIDRTVDTGIYQFKGKFTNAATIAIGANAASGVHGIFNESQFENKDGGAINIDRTVLAALRNFNGTFTNAAGITIGSVASAGTYGIRNQSAFVNNAGGQIKVDNAGEGIFTEDNTFSNAGIVTIGGVTAISSVLTAQGTGSFSNDEDGVLKASGQVAAAGFANNGGTIAPGYSPGKLTFNDSEDFSNSIIDIEITGKTTAGVDFDQLVVNGTATLGGTLNAIISYSPAYGDEIVILSATSVSGTFGSVTGLPTGWKFIYEPNAVKLRFDDPMPVKLVSFNAKAVGNIVRLDWRTTSEVDNAGFHIERSANGFKWEDIGFVDGNATTSQAKDYVFRDEKPVAGLNYYRLRQTDFDGTTEHSRVQLVRMVSPADEVIVWADAARQGHIKTASTIRQVTVSDLSGHVLAVSQTASFNLVHVASGVVIVKVRTDSGVVVKKLPLF